MYFLDHIIPTPLQEQDLSSSEVWNQKLQISNLAHTFLEAPSGKGKSTFILMLYGVRQDYQGKIVFEDAQGSNDIRNWSSDEWSNHRKNYLSIVFQDLRLFPQLTALENVNIKNDLTQIVNEDDIHAYFEKFGLSQHRNQKAHTLSYGQRQRVAIIRALIQPFKLLLLDEPFSHLDKKNIEIAKELIYDACDKNKAVFLLTSLGNTYDMEIQHRIRL